MSGLRIEQVMAEIDEQPAQSQQQEQPKPPPERKIADVRRDLRLIQQRMARLQASY